MTDGNGNVIQLRLSNLDDKVKTIETVADAAKTVADRHESEINGERGIWKSINMLNDEIKSLRRAAWGIAVSVVGGSILIVLQQGGHL